MSRRKRCRGSFSLYRYGEAGSGLDGLLTAIVHPSFTEELKYDSRNRLTQRTQVLDADTRLSSQSGYDATGNLIASTDPKGRSQLMRYDALRRQVESIDSLGGRTLYQYDARDNLASLTDPAGSTTRYTYDRANRRVKETRPGGEETTYQYDAAGNLTVRQDSLGQERRYAYDNLRRRVREEHYPKLNGQLATEPSRVIVYTYDAKGQLTGYTDTPQQGSASGATYTLDALGRKTTEEINFGPFRKTLATTYRANGQKATLTYPNGDTLGISYDTGGQVQSITSPGGDISFQYQNGQPTRVNLPGATRSLEYDPLQRLTRVLLERGEAGSGNTLLDTRYSYDPVSDITTRQTLEGEYRYQYDPLSRLTAVTPPESLQRSTANPTGLPLEGYQYDGVHNRQASLHQPGPWVYNANHQLLSHGLGDEAVSREYDANGHTLGIGQGALQKRLAYDVAERLVAVHDANGTPIGRYEYDPFGRRQKKTTPTETIYFQYSDQGLIAEYDATGNPLATYGWQAEGMWGTNPLWKKEGSHTYFYSNDHLGTPQLLTDTAGQVVWKAKAEAFGKTTVDAASTITNNLRFPGQYFDAETGWHYNYFRDYEPNIGRYLQSDPIGLRGGANRFGYVAATPLKFADPKGLLEIGASCNQAQRQALQAAESKIQYALDVSCGGCGDYNTGCIPCGIKEKLQDALALSKVTCVDTGDVCGRGQSPGNQIWINPPGWQPSQCGCLEAVVLHELLHNAGMPASEHGAIYGLEKACFPGCALVPGG